MEEYEMTSTVAKTRVKGEFIIEEYNVKEFIRKEYVF